MLQAHAHSAHAFTANMHYAYDLGALTHPCHPHSFTPVLTALHRCCCMGATILHYILTLPHLEGVLLWLSSPTHNGANIMAQVLHDLQQQQQQQAMLCERMPCSSTAAQPSCSLVGCSTPVDDCLDRPRQYPYLEPATELLLSGYCAATASDKVSGSPKNGTTLYSPTDTSMSLSPFDSPATMRNQPGNQ